MKFIQNARHGIYDARLYQSGNFQVSIWKENNDLQMQIKYVKSPTCTLPGYYVPQIEYHDGEFVCNLDILSSMRPKIPDEIEYIKRGLMMVDNCVADIKIFLAERREYDQD